jgi:nitroreductase/dihydropteridine reductase
MSEIINALNWRYAVKRYKNSPISELELNQILETIRLAPTSLGLQPFKVIRLQSPEKREACKPLFNNQPQSVEASDILIFAAYTELSVQLIEEYILRIAQTRNKNVEELQGFQRTIQQFLKSMNTEQFIEWSKKQTYIALGMAMSSAAMLRIDSTPMEGFKHTELDAFLDLPSQKLTSSVILALGKRDEELDFLATSPKVRKSNLEMFEVI